MFYVYSGYVSPDNWDSSNGPTHKLTSFDTADEVAEAKADFEASLNSECAHAIFRVIEGVERQLKPVEVVRSWSLK